MFSYLSSLLHAVQGRFSHSMAVMPHHAATNYSWAPWVYYRLGMYATVADFQSLHCDWRTAMARAVSLAACGHREEAKTLVFAARGRLDCRPFLVPLADALAPFMPEQALDILQDTNAPPALLSALLLRVGRADEAAAVLCKAIGAGQADKWPELHLYQSNALSEEPQPQLARLNAFLQAKQVPPLVLRDQSLPPGPCNVQMAEAAVGVYGPLVSVLMTTFRTGARAGVAIESVLQQSYRNIELIVVDDASGDDTPDIVQAWAERDKRVKLIRLLSNGGTYLAKSVGLQMARGEFVTCHDSDDWSHPLKIERQVQPLLDNKKLVATTSHWVRMQDDGVFYARPVHSLMRLNPSSPLFRRKQVLAQAGAWDCVRTGADSEFLARLRLVFGRHSIKRITQPLALGSHRADSLMTASSTGYSDTGISPQRLAYWEAWSRWHIDALRDKDLPRLPLDMARLATDRLFFAPAGVALSASDVTACLASVEYGRTTSE
ncbi:Glycosyltransferase 2-like domain-containing protein [Comamonas aquatilis]